MRVNSNPYASVNAAIQQTEQALQTAEAQLSSSKRVNVPSDDPLAFATELQSVASSAMVDRYTKNADAVIAQAQMADSALSSVVTSLTKAVSIGTEGGDGTLNSDQRATLVQQVQDLLQNVLALANTNLNGHALFAGTAATQTPFVLDATSSTGFVYSGNGNVNTAQVGDADSVAVNLPGDAIFLNTNGSALGSLQQLVTALKSGNTSDLAFATSAVSAAIASIGQSRATYGSTVAQLNAQDDYLSQETISLASQQTSLVDVDTATAITNLTQAQTAQSAVFAMAAKVLPQSLLNYLH